ncbi:hypothetical protein V5O48_009413 [Marasmius crinis-equi]|uniref:Uncharacterized protein n=1 Tax=Marasmius crinis-equi TaxID=585013 RepID=A0ABR3FBA8_9AGAR
MPKDKSRNKFGQSQNVMKPKKRGNTKTTRPQMTFAQRKAMNEKRVVRNRQIKMVVSQKLQEIQAWAEKQGRMFGKKDRYFKDMIFNGGAHLKHLKREISPYNAFRSEKAREIREAGGVLQTLAEIDVNFGEEYDDMTDEEKSALVARHKEYLAEEAMVNIRLPTQRQIRETVKSAIESLIAIVRALCRRVGMEGFFMLIRSRFDITIPPQWYCTNTKLENYLALAVKGPWDLGMFIGRCEAFVLAGCDVANLATNVQKTVSFLKGEVRGLVKRLLAEATGCATLEMEYKTFDKSITKEYRVVLEGWPLAKFANPSDLGSSKRDMQTLLDALSNGTCHFRKLEGEEWTKWLENYNNTPQPERKQRSDAGVKRGPRKKGGVKDRVEGEGAVDEDDDDDNDNDEEEEKGEGERNSDGSSDDEDEEVVEEQPKNKAVPRKTKTAPSKAAPTASKRATAASGKTGKGKGGRGARSKSVEEVGGPGDMDKRGKVKGKAKASSGASASAEATQEKPQRPRPQPRKIVTQKATPPEPDPQPMVVDPPDRSEAMETEPHSTANPTSTTDLNNTPNPTLPSTSQVTLDPVLTASDSDLVYDEANGPKPNAGDVEMIEMAQEMRRPGMRDVLPSDTMLAPGTRRNRRQPNRFQG